RDGLTTARGRRRQSLAWSSIQRISWVPGANGQAIYMIQGDLPTLHISWPAGLQDVITDRQGGGAVPIGADELAALVAAHIGTPIQIRA
ncbi:MAG TPA: hypothetical protein VGR57_02730, partial [Ktedonobacterales bacterium]|nr:hypothetical protein [Ktedonobacterales bacterium]